MMIPVNQAEERVQELEKIRQLKANLEKREIPVRIDEKTYILIREGDDPQERAEHFRTICQENRADFAGGYSSPYDDNSGKWAMLVATVNGGATT